MRLYMLPRREKFKEEVQEDRKRVFKQWGEIARKCFGCEDEDDFMVRRFKKNYWNHRLHRFHR